MCSGWAPWYRWVGAFSRPADSLCKGALRFPFSWGGTDTKLTSYNRRWVVPLHSSSREIILTQHLAHCQQPLSGIRVSSSLTPHTLNPWLQRLRVSDHVLHQAGSDLLLLDHLGRLFLEGWDLECLSLEAMCIQITQARSERPSVDATRSHIHLAVSAADPATLSYLVWGFQVSVTVVTLRYLVQQPSRNLSLFLTRAGAIIRVHRPIFKTINICHVICVILYRSRRKCTQAM